MALIADTEIGLLLWLEQVFPDEWGNLETDVKLNFTSSLRWNVWKNFSVPVFKVFILFLELQWKIQHTKIQQSMFVFFFLFFLSIWMSPFKLP